MNGRRILLTILAVSVTAGSLVAYGARSASSSILDQMKRRDPQAFAFVQAKGARVETVATAIGTSFYVVWFPPGSKPQSTPVIVTLHGSRGDAAEKFRSWQPEAAKRGYGVIALEWWNGSSRPLHGPESEVNYLSAAQLYSTLKSILKKEKVKPGLALLHGHSRGGKRTYPLAYLDRKGSRFFRLVIGDSGWADPEAADIQAIGSMAGTRFVLYCGERDVGHAIPACEALPLTKSWLESKGGKVELAIDDPRGNHSGFLASPANINRALDVFARLLRGG